MSAHRFWLLLVVTVTLSSVALAQGPGVEVQAGLGYARVFHGGGISFAAAAERPITSDSSALRHALGLSLWYANTTVASTPDAPGGRELVGLPGSFPVEDRGGAAWGWGAGLELGIRVALGDQLSAQTSVQGMYQDIYAASTMSGAWTWHAGVTYRFGARS